MNTLTCLRIEKTWSIKVTVIPVIVVALGTNPKKLEKETERIRDPNKELRLFRQLRSAKIEGEKKEEKKEKHINA